jgi:hypothetical protein
MCRILDDGNAVRAGRGLERLQVDGVAGKVHRDDGLGARRNGRFDLLRIDVQRVRLDVDEHGSSTDMLDHVDRCGERERRADHLVTRTDAERRERGVQGGGAGVQRERGGRAEECREIRLELFSLRAGGNPARPQRIDHFCDFFFTDERRGKGQKLSSGAVAAPRRGNDAAMFE